MPSPAEMAFKPEIGHHGRHHPGLCQPAVFFPAFGDDREQLVAVDHAAALVDDDDAVGVAVKRNADIGAHFAHLVRDRREVGRAAFLVDVEPIRIDADGNHVCAQFPKRSRRHLVGCAIGAIDHDAQAGQVESACGSVRLANSM